MEDGFKTESAHMKMEGGFKTEGAHVERKGGLSRWRVLIQGRVVYMS